MEYNVWKWTIKDEKMEKSKVDYLIFLSNKNSK